MERIKCDGEDGVKHPGGKDWIPKAGSGWVLTEGAAARGRGLQPLAPAAGGLLQETGAGIHDTVGAAHRVPAGATVAGAAAACDCRSLFQGGRRAPLARRPA